MLTKIEQYLRDNIDDDVRLDRNNNVNRLPFSLRDIYRVHSMRILGTKCTLLEFIQDIPGIDAIKKHLKTISQIHGDPIVLGFQAITRYRRKSLIANRIAFVIEDSQMYLPFLSLDLKNTEGKNVEKPVVFTTSAQIAYLYFLYNGDTEVNATELAARFAWSVMTSSRALNELYAAKLLTIKIGGKTGRSKYYRRIIDPDYFALGREYLRSPVKRSVYVRTKPKGSFVAGLDALAELSMLNPPAHEVRAIHDKELDHQQLDIERNTDIIKDENLLELQIWSYDPKLFTKTNKIDPASLYASLIQNSDERVELALEELMREEKWYMV